MLGRRLVVGFALALAACASPPPEPVAPPPAAPPPPPPIPQFEMVSGGMRVGSASFDDLVGWADSDHSAALTAFNRSCPRFAERDPDGRAGPPYAGANGAWSAVCDDAAAVSAGDADMARDFFEDAFVVARVTRMDGEAGLTTAYYEPEIDARRSDYGPFAEPLLARPDDMTSLDVPADRYGQTTQTEVFKEAEDGVLVLYDDRATIRSRFDIPVLAWARLEDVVFLQIQGSGRLRFADGSTQRAAFAAHNGLPYASIARELIDRDIMEEGRASNARVAAWLAVEDDHELVNAVVNANPRYVFFSLKPLGDESEGPVGAANVPLTAQASIAVDPDHHLIGGLYFIDPAGDQAPPARLAAAQDTGGAIKGLLRADLFMGTGDEAGEAAATVRHQTRWWVLIPRDVAVQLAAEWAS